MQLLLGGLFQVRVGLGGSFCVDVVAGCIGSFFLDTATSAKNIHKCGQRSEVLPYLDISTCS